MDNKNLHSLRGGRFTADMLLAYRRGSLPDAERRRLERAMEDDPFLRDAVEGLSLADPDAIERTLAAINRDVEVITGRRRAFRISATVKKYAAAAMILAFFGVTLLIMNRLNKDAAQQQLAMESEIIYPELSNADTGDMGSGSVREDAADVLEKKESTAPEQPMANRITENDMPSEDVAGDIATEYARSESEELVTAPAMAESKDLDDVVSKTNTQSGAVSPVVEKESVSLSEVTIATTDKKDIRKKQKATEKPSTKEVASETDAVVAGAVADSVMSTTPQYPGGQKELDIYFTKNLQYPAGTPNGTAYVEVTISSKGKVSKAVIKKGLSADADKEILRVINAMPDWKPGTVNGKAVEMSVVIPVTMESN